MLHWQPVDPNYACRAYKVPTPNLNPRYIDQDPEFLAYLFENGPRPVNIRGDVRLLGFRYVDKRTKNTDISQFLTAEQRERELQHQIFYEEPLVKSAGSWF